jgi:hypothetical protein
MFKELVSLFASYILATDIVSKHQIGRTQNCLFYEILTNSVTISCSFVQQKSFNPATTALDRC